jgi:hypothetical protein
VRPNLPRIGVTEALGRRNLERKRPASAYLDAIRRDNGVVGVEQVLDGRSHVRHVENHLNAGRRPLPVDVDAIHVAQLGERVGEVGVSLGVWSFACRLVGGGYNLAHATRRYVTGRYIHIGRRYIAR